MNKAELAARVAEETNQTIALTKTIIEKTFDVIKERLYQEEDVNVAGFGKFGIRKKAARTARNPQTGGSVEVPAKNAAYFKPSKELKEYVQD